MLQKEKQGEVEIILRYLPTPSIWDEERGECDFNNDSGSKKFNFAGKRTWWWIIRFHLMNLLTKDPEKKPRPAKGK